MYSAAIKKKLALHIFKLVGGLVTIWPPSVPETSERRRVVDLLVDSYRGINSRNGNPGTWSTKPGVLAYPETIRKAKNFDSFYPAYHRALTT